LTRVLSIEQLLNEAQRLLAAQNIDTPKLDAEILLARVLGKPRSYLMTWPEKSPEAQLVETFRAWVKRRASLEPVAYILGDQEFYGHLFSVGPSVLIPRPETEHLVEKALDWTKVNHCRAPKILDLCTGSGCVGLTLALEMPEAEVTLSDLCGEALTMAQENIRRHGLEKRVRVLESDLFQALDPGETFDLVLANPPYVEESYRAQMQKDVFDFEPHLALFAAEDGLSVIQRIVLGAPGFLRRPGLLAMEIGAGQSSRVLSLLTDGWKNPGVVNDLGGHERIAFAEHRDC